MHTLPLWFGFADRALGGDNCLKRSRHRVDPLRFQDFYRRKTLAKRLSTIIPGSRAQTLYHIHNQIYCTKQQNCQGQQLLANLVGFVKANGLAEMVDIDATFSSRPQAEGTIGLTIGDLVLDMDDHSIETLGKAIQEGVKAL